MQKISQRTIDNVKEASILEVIRHYVPDLKKKGTNHVGCCPFHDEKTPSFSVSESKDLFKCFGCDVSGDAIKFVMEYEKTDFLEAIKNIADLCGIQIEYEEESDDYKQQKEEKLALTGINKLAAKYYREALQQCDEDHPAKKELEYRQLDADTCIKFEIGYAPNQWRFITDYVVKTGLFSNARDIGLVKTKHEKNYDVFRNRIMFPIHDIKGQIVGFGGQNLDKKNKELPKYLNSKESNIYHKNKVLYGLYHAIKGIKKLGYAVLVEGYYDVISFHRIGITNTIAPCGTSLTDEQAKLIHRYTDRVVIMYDGDEAGQKAAIKAIDVLLAEKIKVEIYPLPKDHDPDSMSRGKKVVPKYIEAKRQDAVIYKIEKTYDKASTLDDKDKAME